MWKLSRGAGAARGLGLGPCPWCWCDIIIRGGEGSERGGGEGRGGREGRREVRVEGRGI